VSELLERRGPIGDSNVTLELRRGHDARRGLFGRPVWWVTREWVARDADGSVGVRSETTFRQDAADAYIVLERLEREARAGVLPASVMGQPPPIDT
jgi:hypothetical protein